MKKSLVIFLFILICSGILLIKINAEEETSYQEEICLIQFHLAEMLDYVQWGNGYTKETDIGTLEFETYLVPENEREKLVTEDIFPQVLFTEEEIENGWKVVGYGYWNTDWIFVPIGGFDDVLMSLPPLSLVGSGYEGISGLVIYIIQDKIGEGEANRIDAPDGIDDRLEVVIRFIDWDGSLIDAQILETTSRLKWVCAEDMSWCDNVELAKLYLDVPKQPSRMGWTFDCWDREFENIRFYEDAEIQAVYIKNNEFYISIPKIITLDGKGEKDSHFVVAFKGSIPRGQLLHVSIKGINEFGFFDLFHTQHQDIYTSTNVFFLDGENWLEHEFLNMFEVYIDGRQLSEETYNVQLNGIVKRCKFPIAGSYTGEFLFSIELEGS